MRDIRKVAVLGAGTMGVRIAAQLANASVPCLLLDIIPEELTPGEQARGLRLDAPGKWCQEPFLQALFHDTEEIFIMRSFSEQSRAKIRAVQRMINHPANIHSPRSAHK